MVQHLLKDQTFWQVLSNNGLWFKLITVKYLKKNTVLSWIHRKDFFVIGVSTIWKGFINIISWLGCGLIWMVGDGKNTRVGLDPIAGLDTSFTLPKDLRDCLEDYGIISLAQARNYSLEAPSY